MLYMPIIKSKRGELTALKLLDRGTKQQITPFLDAIPPNPYADKPRTLAKHIMWVADHFADAWEAQGEVFVDTFDIGPVVVQGKQVAIEYLCRALREKDVRVIPVTGIQREPAHDIAVAKLLAESSIGVCFRLEEEDIELHATIAELMIFANKEVAVKIQSFFPSGALLRRHPLPPLNKFKDLVACTAARGLPCHERRCWR